MFYCPTSHFVARMSCFCEIGVFTNGSRGGYEEFPLVHKPSQLLQWFVDKITSIESA